MEIIIFFLYKSAKKIWIYKKKLYLCTTFNGSYKGDSVAQLVEQYTFNVWVLGSNPSQVTKKTISLRGEIGRHAILRGWYPKDVLVRIQSQTPIRYLFIHIVDLVAQLVEQYTFNVWVLGSNPSQVTFK